MTIDEQSSTRYIGAIYRRTTGLRSARVARSRDSRGPGRPSAVATLRAVRHHVDYALARRAVLRDLRTGKRDRLDVCDAQPELLRAARNLGEPIDGDCPVCGVRRPRAGLLRLRRRAAPRQRPLHRDAEELAQLDAAHEEFSRYVVEVCLDCHWNHLQRHELHGRRHAG